MREELEKQEEENKKNIKDYEKEQKKKTEVNNDQKDKQKDTVKEEIVYNGLEEDTQTRPEGEDEYKHKCPKCGFEWN